MRIDSQAKSLHYFHVCGVQDRVDISQLDDEPSLPDLDGIDFNSLLPTTADEKAIKGLFAFMWLAYSRNT